ncbi:MAG: hypothetical protein ACYDA0_13245 [Candidatus Dormibacteraceae bacterium]
MAAPNSLPEPQGALLSAIYEGLKQRGNWPPFSYVDRVLDREGLDIDKVADGLPADLTNVGPGMRHISGDEEVTMTIAGLYHCPGAENDLRLFLQAVSTAVVIERSQELSVEGGTRAVLTSSIVGNLGADMATLQRLHLFMRYEPWGGGGGTTADGNWEIAITRAIRRFSGVKSIEEYLQRRADFFGQGARIPPAVRLGLRPGTVLGVEPEPAEQQEGKYIFVIMPLKAEFDSVYKTIRTACGKFPGVTFDRADDWSKTGRITDQIIEALKTAHLIIADITGPNANVMYELGYAHALEKQVIVMNADRGSPFDVQDYRQILYTNEDLPSAEESLTRFVQTALGIEPNR